MLAALSELCNAVAILFARLASDCSSRTLSDWSLALSAVALLVQVWGRFFG